MKGTKLWVLGLPIKDYTPQITIALKEADKIIAARHLENNLSSWREKFPQKNWIFYERFSQALEEAEKALGQQKKVAFWASGDPLFFGVARTFLTRLNPEEIKVVPALSSLQVAFAESKIPWEDALFVSLHGQNENKINDLKALLRRQKKLLVLTDPQNSPAKIANYLLAAGLGSTKMIVAERLGFPEEKIYTGPPAEFASKDFKNPNLVILLQEKPGEPPVFGLKEDEFLHEKGLITKDEVRAVAIHKLRLPPQGVFWDIGAGSGSVACEVANLAPGLLVYAVEKSPERTRMIEKNRENLGLPNLTVVEGKAPEVLAPLPSPDRIFIGGGGKDLRSILETSWLKLKSGLVVIAVITIESLEIAYQFLKEKEGLKEVVSIQVSRSSNRISGYTYLQALNQVYLLVGEKHES
ncbi:hypothetical protein TH606_02825 [Thermodesulfatator autotrophicus]|uniref:tRNA (guanine(46)-N(7))-methyltransferase n=2 Tax=Thermodesulfatator autotrophicus TaxID=1795632 RepID=A0A177E9V3_9BACT|nr:hypothetical protein TH606_02825 [Thermodesulfatator autotrophicus]